MPADLFREVLRRHESDCVAVLRRLTGIARTMSRRVIEFSTLPLRHRLHAELLRLARLDAADPRRRTALIAPAPTHADMASRISTHREAVSRELAELTRSGLVERRGGDLILRDVGASPGWSRRRSKSRWTRTLGEYGRRSPAWRRYASPKCAPPALTEDRIGLAAAWRPEVCAYLINSVLCDLRFR